MSVAAYPAYLDSGVEWLGPIPEGWSVKPLWAMTTCNDDVLSDSTPSDYMIDYIEISDVDAVAGVRGRSELEFSAAPSRARRRVRDGDVIVSTVRTYLRAIAALESPSANTVVSTGFAVMRPRAVHAGYLAHLFRAEFLVNQIIARSVGVSYPAINASEISHLNVPVPSPDEQTAIAAFLDHETAKIDALVVEQERLIALLKEKRQAVISHAVTKGLDPNAPMKDSGVEWLGQVPAHWEVKALNRVVRDGSSITYGIVQAGPDIEGGIPYIRTSDMAGTALPETGYLRTSLEIADAYQRSAVTEGDLVIAIRATVGKTLPVPVWLDGANLTRASFSPILQLLETPRLST